MTDMAIRVENLSKRYRIGQRQSHKTLRERLTDAMSSPFRRLSSIVRRPSGAGNNQRTARDEFIWALKDVSFEIRRGEVMGIIGRNGAGKTTLLKILCRITEPTEGRAEIRGRVGSLLEVGTGFHYELTGRENIYLNGAILGMKKAEIERKFDEIVAFAEVEKFLDTPVKHFSSGMYVRLAFAVAAHLEPEVLLVDEVLAVGDVEFQKKCLGKMGDVAKEGRTVLFVSHNMAAVQNLCTRGMTLQNGRLQMIGSQFEAVSAYLASLSGNRSSLLLRKDRVGTGEVRVESIEFVDRDGCVLDSAACGQEIGVRLYFTRTGTSLWPRINVGIIFKSQLDVPIFLHHNRLTRKSFGPLPEKGYFELRIKKLPLPPALYRIGYSLLQDGAYIDGIEDAVEISVTAGDFFGSGEVPPSTHGVCLVDASWSMEIVRSKNRALKEKSWILG
jgi:lipopolysaccharide transport system ATP-binding protein